jgi:HEPN domain-containing protein
LEAFGMINRGLVRDYLERCGHRLAAIDVLHDRRSWPDVVRESQEVVELALKALLRHANVDAPRVHDVGRVVLECRSALPQPLRPHADRMAAISKNLRRDREMAFYGSEDLTPGEFYDERDAQQARDDARWLVDVICEVILA